MTPAVGEVRRNRSVTTAGGEPDGGEEGFLIDRVFVHQGPQATLELVVLPMGTALLALAPLMHALVLAQPISHVTVQAEVSHAPSDPPPRLRFCSLLI